MYVLTATIPAGIMLTESKRVWLEIHQLALELRRFRMPR
jgi:hypothetical protein